MKPETAVSIEQGRIMLGRADRMLAAELNEDAARCAYLACFHVAQALNFERVDRVFKTHSGVQTEFHRLTRGDTGINHDLRKFLSRAYAFKAVADYGAGTDAVVSAAEASHAASTAKRFVEHFAGLIAAGCKLVP